MNQSNITTNSKYNKHLTYTDRIKMETYIKEKRKLKYIGVELGKSTRTIQREYKCGKVLLISHELIEYESYSADIGQKKYDYKATSKGCNLKINKNHSLINFMKNSIKNEKNSVEVSLHNAKQDGEVVDICVKTMYNYINDGIFVDLTRDDLIVRKHKTKKRKDRRHKYLKGTSIEDRPEHVNERKEIGHWEMDCVVGTREKGKTLLVLTERVTCKEIILILKRKTMENVVKALKKIKIKYKSEEFKRIFKTITVDNGTEFKDFKSMEKLGPKVYYCHPYSSGERGTNENQNKLIRRWIPKGVSMDNLTSKFTNKIEDWMNNYPRRRYGFKTPNELFVQYTN